MQTVFIIVVQIKLVVVGKDKKKTNLGQLKSGLSRL